jgi:hypothetical protein
VSPSIRTSGRILEVDDQALAEAGERRGDPVDLRAVLEGAVEKPALP